MEITTQVVVMVFALMAPNGAVKQGIAIPPTLGECNRTATIIINDFRILRETESKMKEEDIEPRIKLLAIECMADVEVPINGMITKHPEQQL